MGASGYSLFHNSSTKYGVPECYREASQLEGPGPLVAVATWKRNFGSLKIVFLCYKKNNQSLKLILLSWSESPWHIYIYISVVRKLTSGILFINDILEKISQREIRGFCLKYSCLLHLNGPKFIKNVVFDTNICDE